MGAIYRRKLKSCKMCKLNKMGWAPARTDKETNKLNNMRREEEETCDQTRGQYAATATRP